MDSMEVSFAGTGAGLDSDGGGSCLSRRRSDLGNNVILSDVRLCLGSASDGPYQYAYAQNNPKGDPYLFWNLCQEGNDEQQGV